MKGILELVQGENYLAKIILDNNQEILIYDNNVIIDNKLLHGDIVEYNNDVITLINRQHKIYGSLILSDKQYVNIKKKIFKKFIPDNPLFPSFVVQLNDKLKNDFHDKYCSVKIKEWNDKFIIASIVQLFGNIGEYDIEKKYIIHKYGNVKESTITLDQNIDITPDRKNLTDLLTFSIDPYGCQDIDDAFSVEQYATYLKLYIHIADVSSYIEHNSQIDKILLERCESIYLSNNIISMLPDTFANNICSLKKGCIRRAFTTEFIMNGNQIMETKSYKSFIFNKFNLTYDEAQHIVSNKSSNDLSINLSYLYELGKLLYNHDDEYDTHKMVESFMILINKHVAEQLAKYYEKYCIMRVCKQNICYNNDYTIYEHAKSYLINKAYYQVGTINSTHEVLGIPYYTHFSSPIRRYVDLIIHRMYYDAISNNFIDYHDNINIVNHLNTKTRSLKKMMKDDKLIELIYNIYNNYNSVYNTDAIIININDNKLILYIEEFNIMVTKKIFPDVLKKSLSYTSNHNVIIVNDCFSMSIYDIINIDIVISINALRIRDKLLINIVNPNVSII